VPSIVTSSPLTSARNRRPRPPSPPSRPPSPPLAHSQRKADDGSQVKPPKRARTAYLVFCDRHRPRIMDAVHPGPNAKFTREEMQQVTTKLATLWKSISPSELAECKAEALKLKDEYDAAKAALPPGALKRTHKKKGKNAQILVEGSGEKPKRARTAYLIFCDRYRNQIMKEVHPDPTSKFTREEMQQVTTRLAEMWKIVDPHELQACRIEADLCKDEYKKQKEAYVPPVYAAASKGKKGKKGDKDGKPKRPRTAYLLFAEDCRARLKKTDPGLSFTETSQVVSREWKELTDAKKNAYIRTADKEQEKHRVAKANWEAKNMVSIPSAHAVPPPIPA
jgi:hypothetical protein